MVHTNASAKTGLLALEALTSHGVDPTRIVVAHMGDSNDLDYLRAIADTGAWLGCDRFNIPHFNPDANRIETLTKLVAEGYAGQIHLSHDGACFYDFMTGDPNFADERPDYLHIWSTILPALLGGGRHAGADRPDDDREPAAVLRSSLSRTTFPGFMIPRGSKSSLIPR